MSTPDWAGAACIGHDPDMWFPEGGEHGLDAELICNTCPLLLQCRDYARTHSMGFGVWGGEHTSGRARAAGTTSKLLRQRSVTLLTSRPRQCDAQGCATWIEPGPGRSVDTVRFCSKQCRSADYDRRHRDQRNARDRSRDQRGQNHGRAAA